MKPSFTRHLSSRSIFIVLKAFSGSLFYRKPQSYAQSAVELTQLFFGGDLSVVMNEVTWRKHLQELIDTWSWKSLREHS